MTTLLKDIKYGLRGLLRKPGFTVVAVLTLALGIGVTTALFTVFDAFALRPLPLKNPEQLVNISGLNARGERMNLFSYIDYLDYRDRSDVFAGLVAMNKVAAPLGDAVPGGESDVLPGDVEYVPLQMVSDNYFSVLGAKAETGRALVAEDNEPGAQPVIILSHWFWEHRFNSDTGVAGKTLRLRGETFTVVGVAERGFIGTSPDAPAGWIPLAARDRVLPAGFWNYRRWLTDRDADSVTLVGRLKPGVSREQAQAAMSLIAGQLATEYPEDGRKVGVTLASGMAFVHFSAEELQIITPLLLAVGLVLLIACANVANLLLARAATRQKEIAVRLALGASRWRLVRQLLTESMLLGVVGGASGLLLSVWTLSALYPLVISSLPLPAGLKESFTLNLEPDFRIFGFTLLASLVAGIVAGLAPALQASKPDLASALKDEGSTLSPHLSQSRLRNALVVTQIAVCLTLLVGAGLLVRNVRSIQTLDIGFETKNVLAAAVGLRKPDAEGRGDVEARRLLAERLRGLPGVKSVSQAYRTPLAGGPAKTAATLSASERDGGHPFEVNYNVVSPDYFDTLGLRIVRGRAFNGQEAQTGARVVVISEATARRLWPGEDPIGKRIGVGANLVEEKEEDASQAFGGAGVFPSFEVVGVARDARSGWVWQKDGTFLYVPLSPNSRLGQQILISTERDAQAFVPALRREARAVGDLLVSARRPEEALEFQMSPFRSMAMLAGALGMLALALAGVGLYGVMSFVVSQRTREIGIRVALGAQPRDCVRLFMRQGLRLTAVGLVFGIAGGAAVARMLASALVDLSPLDPASFGSASIFLACVALLSCYIPARRATKVDPMVALRYE
ncbi:MAG: ABC transporter permease [Acidobacteria bacterium]|nr:ABC transporter permease [Acidobacteriota bacterium]